MNEAEIITNVCAGDLDQYGQLVERYQVGLIIHCDRLLGDRDEAEDVAQKAFIKAYDKLPDFDTNKARYSTWLYRIATNMALDVLRSQKRVVPHDMEDVEGPGALDAALMHDETIREVRAAVLALMPPEQRRAIEAYYWEGLSYQAIADEAPRTGEHRKKLDAPRQATITKGTIMSGAEFEAYLLAARPTGRVYNHFTQSVIDTIRQSAVSATRSKPPKRHLWQSMVQYAQHSVPRAIAVAVVALVVITCIGFSSYAYATGTNPVSLIKRLVIGKEVKVIYQDPQTSKQREFVHGATRTYSDLAVSAYAEVSLIDKLHFHAAGAYTAPKDGIEYITDPFNTEYLLARLGTIERVTEDEITVHLTYYMGLSKVERSRDIDEHITIPRAYFYYYREGKAAAVQPAQVGALVEVFQDHYLRHKQHSGERPTPVSLYSVFAVSHSLDAIKEATTTTGPVNARTDEELQKALSEQNIYETGVGAWAEQCSNNGADTCQYAFRDTQPGENLFDARITPGFYGGPANQHPNPAMIPYGEAIAVQTDETRQYMLRDIEGEITKIAGDRITLKTSSGELWTFQYSAENQKIFGKVYRQPLKGGQLIGGGVLVSVFDWDRRDFDNQYVYGMTRYK